MVTGIASGGISNRHSTADKAVALYVITESILWVTLLFGCG